LSLSAKTFTGLVLGTVAILLATAALGFYLMHVPAPSPPDLQSNRDPADARRQDLAYLKRALREVDRSFSADEWVAFDRAIDGLSRRAEALDAAAFEMGVAKAVAAANNGHTNLIAASWGLTLNSIPLRFYWFADGLYVVKADPGLAELLGARVISLGENTPAELSQRLRAYVGGRESLSRELSIHFMESPQALHAIGAQADSSTMALTLETMDGSVTRRDIAAAPVPVNGAPANPYLWPIWPRRSLSNVPVSADARPWRHVLDDRAVPFTLEKPDRLYRATWLADDRILFVQINGTMDDPGHPRLETFLDVILEEAGQKKPRFAIVDLRSNPGGSYPLTADFTRTLPRLIPDNGRIFILTSANTFSAGIVTAARLKHFAGARAPIVGEPMGDFPQFWAEAATRIVLPNSGLRVGYATKYHDWENGCSLGQILVCFPLNYYLGVAAGDLDPEIPVTWTFGDYLRGRDTVVDRVLDLIAEARGVSQAPHVGAAEAAGAALSSPIMNVTDTSAVPETGAIPAPAAARTSVTSGPPDTARWPAAPTAAPENRARPETP
jgi:hypothetical protein